MGITLTDSRYFILEGTASNSTYVSNKEEIKILKKEGNVIPLSAASEILPLSVYSHTLIKAFCVLAKRNKMDRLTATPIKPVNGLR